MGNQSPKQSGGSGYEDLEVKIEQEFKRNARNGKIDKINFHDALSILQTFGFRRISDTPLADRLFVIFDTDRGGWIEEAEYKQGIKNILDFEEQRIQYSWKAFIKNSPDQRLKKSDFIEFFELTWLKAFSILEQYVYSDPKYIKYTGIKFQEWASLNLSNLVKELDYEWRKYTSTDVMDYRQFRDWAKNTTYNYVVAGIDNFKIELATNLAQMK